MLDRVFRPDAHLIAPMAVLSALVIALSACGRGPAPLQPTEMLTPTVVGFIDRDSAAPPIPLAGGEVFGPPPGVPGERIRNWPADAASEPDGIHEGDLLLGGTRADGTWWYQLIVGGFPRPACVLVAGGSFDRGDAIQLSSGIMLPKADGFEIRDPEPGPSNWFPGHAADAICVDADGHAVYFQPFHPV